MPPNIVIDVRKLSFAFPAGPQALREVSFQLTTSESLGVVGPNGAGKTTLFLCLSGVLNVPRARCASRALIPQFPRTDAACPPR